MTDTARPPVPTMPRELLADHALAIWREAHGVMRAWGTVRRASAASDAMGMAAAKDPFHNSDDPTYRQRERRIGGRRDDGFLLMVVRCGALSRTFWPPSVSGIKGESRDDRRARQDRTDDRGRQLREWLEVRDDSPLAVRAFRNTFEHWDERVDQWHATNDRDLYNSFNTRDLVVRLGKDTVDLAALAQVVRRIQRVLQLVKSDLGFANPEAMY